MKLRLLILSLLTFTIVSTFAQDDFLFPDYRSKRDLFKRIQEKDIRADIAIFNMAGIDESVGKDPLDKLPIKNYGKDFIEFEGNKIKVIIQGGVFDPKKHKLNMYDTKYLVKIDNRGFFGDYGKTPKTTIEKVSVIFGRDTVQIPEAAFNDLYNPIYTVTERGVVKSSNNVYLSADGKKVYIYMLKKETGGSYEVTWVIQDKQYIKRVVDFGFLP